MPRAIKFSSPTTPLPVGLWDSGPRSPPINSLLRRQENPPLTSLLPATEQCSLPAPAPPHKFAAPISPSPQFHPLPNSSKSLHAFSFPASLFILALRSSTCR